MARALCNNSIWHAAGLGCSTEGNGFGGVQNVEVPLLVIPLGIGPLWRCSLQRPWPALQCAGWPLSAGKAINSKWNPWKEPYWIILVISAFFGRVKWGGRYGLGSCVSHRGKPIFAPITALFLPVSFTRQMGGGAPWYSSRGKHRLVVVLAQWALDYCNIKPSTDFKALCRHQREFPTRCTASERPRHSK